MLCNFQLKVTPNYNNMKKQFNMSDEKHKLSILSRED